MPALLALVSPRVLLAAALVVAVLGASWGLYEAGKGAQRAAAITDTLTAVERRNETDRDIARLPDGAAAERLRRYWSRE